MKRKVVVVGGGVAGLTVAYYLRHNKYLDITIVESDGRLGGRLYTDFSDNHMSEMGGFLVLDWYAYTKRIVRELGLSDSLVKLSNSKELFWDDHEQKFVTRGRSPLSGLATQAMWRDPFLLRFLRKKYFYDPPLNNFRGATAFDVISRATGDDPSLIEVAERIVVGYCYGSLRQLPASLYIGFLGCFLRSGGFAKASTVRGGIEVFLQKLAYVLQDSGVSIRRNETVKDVGSGKVHTNKATLDADIVIYANGPPDEPISSSLSTRLCTVSGVMREPFASRWMAAYTPYVKSCKDPQLVSIGQVGSASDLNSNTQFIACMKLPDSGTGTYEKVDVAPFLEKEVKQYLPDCNIGDIIAVKYWNKTMPIVSADAVLSARARQGQNNVYYVGDYFSAPCIETAVYSSYNVARLVEKSI